MDKKNSDSFLILCKEIYLDGVTPPPNKSNSNNEKYIMLIAIAKEYFKNEEYDEFAGFFMEGQYFIQLWAAHLILEYGSPTEDLKIRSISVIKKYSNNPLAPEVAKEERQWINENAEKYKDIL